MSPGTSVAAATVCHLPSRITVASGASPFLSAASALDALRSCQNSSAALKNNSAAIMTKSSQCPMIAETIAAASIHVGVRAGEVPHDLAEQADLFFDEGVGSVFGEPFARFGAAQSLLGLDGELGEDLFDRQSLEVDRSLRSNLRRSRSGLQGNGGHGLLLGTRSRE